MTMALTVKQAAEELQVSTDCIYRMCYAKQIPHNRTAGRGKRGQGRIRIPRSSLEKWLEGGIGNVGN